MLKKIICLAVCFFTLFGVWFGGRTPVFAKYSDSYELYVGSASSNAGIITVDEKNFPFVQKVSGECVTLDGNIKVQDITEKFDAVLVFTESVAEGVSFYAYSEKIGYEATVKGEKVNLHVFVGKDYVKVGSPIIYGSF